VKHILDELVATRRDVARRAAANGEEEIAVVLRRTYRAPVGSVWSALTDPDRLRRWFAPVTGDLRLGGQFQVEGNAGGEVLHCEEPDRLTLTWGGPASVVDVRLSPEGEQTTLELVHTVPVAFAGSGAGALYVGPGWDVAVLGLGRYVAGVRVEDPAAWENSPEGRRLAAGSVDAWIATVRASGTATAVELAGATEAARAQFAPDELPAG
jgi:uncharacterized protein YndB with AHSA1/START domain